MFGPRGAGASRGSDDLHNEDRYLVADELGLYVVCDGHGDAPGGEVAAYLASEAIQHFLDGIMWESRGLVADSQSADRHRRRAAGESFPPFTAATIHQAMRYALAAIEDAAEDRADLVGMGSTVTLLLIQSGRAFIGHTGDSRAYLVRRDDLVQLTLDHEWTREGEAVEEPGSGFEKIDSFSLTTRAGDTFVLCTDGAERSMSNEELIISMHDYSPRLLASRIVAAAHRQDPTVDATAVVVRVRDDQEFAWAAVIEPRRQEGHARVVPPLLMGRRAQRPYDFDQLITRSVQNGGSMRRGTSRSSALA